MTELDPTQTTVTTAGSAAITTPDPVDPLASSKQIKDSGLDLNQVDWMARHNGAVGAAKQRIAALTEENGKLDFKVKDQAARLELANAKIAELEAASGKLPDIEKQLSTTTAEKSALTDKLNKQQVLFGYPQLLNVGPEGGANPWVELVMSSNLGTDDLKKQLDAVAASMPSTRIVAPGLPPGAPAQASSGAAVNYHKKAQVAYGKWIDSHQTDEAAHTEFEENMRLHKQSVAQQAK